MNLNFLIVKDIVKKVDQTRGNFVFQCASESILFVLVSRLDQKKNCKNSKIKNKGNQCSERKRKQKEYSNGKKKFLMFFVIKFIYSYFDNDTILLSNSKVFVTISFHEGYLKNSLSQLFCVLSSFQSVFRFQSFLSYRKKI